MKRMTIGQIVDYCVEWENTHNPTEQEKRKARRRKATAADYAAFFG